MRFRKKRRILRMVGWIILLAVFAGCAPKAVDYDQVGPEDKLILKFSHVTGQDTPKGLAAQRFKELVEQRSQGKVEVQVFPNSTLYSDEEELEELQRGGIQLIAPAISKLSDVVEEVEYFDLPYIFSSPQEVWQTVDGPVGQEVKRLLKEQGYLVLAVWDSGFKQMTNSVKPIRRIADFEGLRFRTMPSGALVKQFELVHAESVFVPFHELYVSLEKGEVHGEENTISNIHNKKLYHTQKYLTKSDHGYLGYFVMANQAFWEQIPAETREMLERTMQEVTEWERNLALRIDKEDYLEIKRRGDMQIIELTAEEKREWQKALRPAYEWYANRIDNEVIESALKQD